MLTKYTGETLLSLENLSIGFPIENDGKQGQEEIHWALQHLSFQIKKGEWVALVGESGSGKSLTALSILNLLPKHAQQSGHIGWKGGSSMSKSDRLQIAMVFQEPMTALNPLMTCGAQIMEQLQVHLHLSREEAKNTAINWLKKVEIPEPEKAILKYPHQMSGGQKQRVVLAMAMCTHPQLLLCDEPTTALDYDVQISLLQLLKKLQQEMGMAILFITHDLQLVESAADRVLVLYKGKLLEEQTTANLFKNPVHPYTQALLQCRPSLHPKGKKLPVVSDFLEDANALHAEQKGKNDHILTSSQQENQSAALAHPCVAPLHLSAEPSHLTAEPSHSSVECREHQPIMVIKNLTVEVSDKRGITKRLNDQINFSIQKGETLGISGPSGCGKTTLGRAILQLIPTTPTTEIWWGNKNLAALSRKEWLPYRKLCQIIFQDPFSSLNPSFSIQSLLEEPLKIHEPHLNKNQRLQKILTTLEQVELASTSLLKYPHEFSGGQRQRIGIARALIMQPQFIICDESVSALDVSVQAQILNLLNQLKIERSLTYLFISHDRDVVKYFCDRVLQMNNGRMLN